MYDRFEFFKSLAKFPLKYLQESISFHLPYQWICLRHHDFYNIYNKERNWYIMNGLISLILIFLFIKHSINHNIIINQRFWVFKIFKTAIKPLNHWVQIMPEKQKRNHIRNFRKIRHPVSGQDNSICIILFINQSIIYIIAKN